MGRAQGRDNRKHGRTAWTVAPLIAVIVLLVCAPCLSAQTVTDSMMGKEQQARELEKEIATLESRLAAVNQDYVSMSRRLEEVQKRIMDYYLEVDAAEAQVTKARDTFNSNLRLLYVRGRADQIMDLITSKDVTDLIVKSEYLARLAVQDSVRYRNLDAKKRDLQVKQARLEQYKAEEARLSRTADTTAIQAQIDLKRGQLAQLTGQIISMQLPATQTPAPTTFDPGRIYSMPDQSTFSRTGQEFSGYSSWYGDSSNGKTTSSGEVFDEYAFTCANRTLPFGTWLRVTFKGRSVVVKVNDRGPSVPGRILDLSRGAAEAIGLTGVQWVDCEIVVPKG
jgi:rare lipoprotein A (peptidoglycan hydrolase)